MDKTDQGILILFCIGSFVMGLILFCLCMENWYSNLHEDPALANLENSKHDVLLYLDSYGSCEGLDLLRSQTNC